MKNGYNGFSFRQREITWKIQKKLREQGRFDWTKEQCCMCGCSKGLIMPHLENYFDWENYYPLCVECHMKLHARYNAWNGWIDYLNKLRNGYQSLGFDKVFDYFRTADNRQYFAFSKNQPFIPSKVLWYENLKATKINLYQELVDNESYSKNHIEQYWKQIKRQK